MAWLSIIFLLSATFCHLSESVHDHKNLTPAVVVGTVYCDTCFQHDTSKNSRFIPGATVAVECSAGDSPRPSFRREAKTNEHGEFRVALPFSVSNNVRKIKRCSVTLISSSEPFCAVSSRAVSSSLHLKSRKQGDHIQIFSAGFFSFKPENQPEICNQKPKTTDNTSRFGSEKSSEPSVPDPSSSSFPPPLEDPPESGNQFHLPHLPRLPPLPQLPPLPSLPGLPLLPPRPEKAAIERKTLELKDPDFFFPIIPQFFLPVLPQPPPLIPPVLPQPPPLIPPVLPQPPPLISPVLPQPPPLIPPILPQPPPSPLLPPLPPVPGLTPPPSPPPPALPGPLPPLLPFPPPSPPGFPGIPPASSFTISSKKPYP